MAQRANNCPANLQAKRTPINDNANKIFANRGLRRDAF